MGAPTFVTTTARAVAAVVHSALVVMRAYEPVQNGIFLYVG